VLETNDVAALTRLWARVGIVEAEIRTLEAMPLQSRARTVLAISKVDLECATTRLQSSPDRLELDYLGQWLEMVEGQLRAVRNALSVIGAAEPPKARRSA
jgi:hypothetical protein